MRCHGAPGHPARELPWDAIAATCMDGAAQTRLDPGQAQRAVGLLPQLDTCPAIGEVVALFHGQCAVVLSAEDQSETDMRESAPGCLPLSYTPTCCLISATIVAGGCTTSTTTARSGSSSAVNWLGASLPA